VRPHDPQSQDMDDQIICRSRACGSEHRRQRDRRQRRPPAQRGRGAGPHRRKRRRQVDHWPVRHVLCPCRGAYCRWRGQIWAASTSGPWMPRAGAVRGKRIAYIAQSATAAFNPAHTIMDQVCEAPLIHRLMSRPEAEAWARQLFRRSTCRTRHLRCALSAPGLGRPVAAGHGGHGDVLPPGRAGARRAHHRARRDDADRGADPAQVADPPVQHRGAVHHARPGGGGPGGRPHQGAAPWQGGRGGPVDQILHNPRQDYTARLVAVRGAAASERAVQSPSVRTRPCCPSRTARPFMATSRSSRASRWTSSAARPWRWWGSPARASPPSHG
jgi:hypothetical protein